MKSATSAEPLLTMQQAAQHLNVTDRTIRNYVARGLIPAQRVGPKLLRIRQSDLDAFLGTG